MPTTKYDKKSAKKVINVKNNILYYPRAHQNAFRKQAHRIKIKAAD